MELKSSCCQYLRFVFGDEVFEIVNDHVKDGTNSQLRRYVVVTIKETD